MTVRVAVVGCGTVTRVAHLPGLRAGGDADVVAFASRRLSSAEAARDQWGSGEATTDWRGAVTRDDVEAVHVCVPNSLHYDVAAEALRAGKHVLVEKPITTQLDDADRLLAYAGDAGVRLGVAFDLRCHPVVGELRRRVAGIGPLSRARIGFGHRGPQEWAPEATWFRDESLSGGGCLMDLGGHVLDLVAATLGAVDAVTRAKLDGPVDEDAVLALSLTSGAEVEVDLSWCAPAPYFSVEVVGERGVVTVEAGVLRQDGEPVDVLPVELSTAAGAFARAIATGTEPVATGADGRAALAVTLAGYEAARTGAPVTVR